MGLTDFVLVAALVSAGCAFTYAVVGQLERSQRAAIACANVVGAVVVVVWLVYGPA